MSDVTLHSVDLRRDNDEEFCGDVAFSDGERLVHVRIRLSDDQVSQIKEICRESLNSVCDALNTAWTR